METTVLRTAIEECLATRPPEAECLPGEYGTYMLVWHVYGYTHTRPVFVALASEEMALTEFPDPRPGTSGKLQQKEFVGNLRPIDWAALAREDAS